MKGGKAMQDNPKNVLRDRSGNPTLSLSTNGEDPHLPHNNMLFVSCLQYDKRALSMAEYLYNMTCFWPEGC